VGIISRVSSPRPARLYYAARDQICKLCIQATPKISQ